MRILIIVCALIFGNAAQAAEQEAAMPPAVVIEAEHAAEALPGAVRNLLRYALDQDGVSYRRGGNSPASGFDCSGFVRYVFGRVEGVSLPHSARAISHLGNRIEKKELLPGDLVFFRFMKNTVSHVGIYLGDDRFIHASSTRTGAVVVSSLTDGYWLKHFVLARRIELPAVQAPLNSAE